jgi:hypothetical protein
MESGGIGDHIARLVVAMVLFMLPVVSTAGYAGKLSAINMEAQMVLDLVHLVKQLIHTMSMELV